MASSIVYQNELLASLPLSAQQTLGARLELVELERGAVLYREGDETVRSAWFPLTALLSLGRETDEGTSVQVAIVGHEGMGGVTTLIGGQAFSSCTVLRGGTAMCVSAAEISAQFEQNGAVRRTLLAYLKVLLGEVAQHAACARHHSAQGQLATLLLLTLDRAAGSGELPLTHESIGLLLGVRRETVSHAAGILRAAGIVRYQRGRIDCLDRKGLEQIACGCYRWLRQHHGKIPTP